MQKTPVDRMLSLTLLLEPTWLTNRISDIGGIRDRLYSVQSLPVTELVLLASTMIVSHIMASVCIEYCERIINITLSRFS